MKLYYTKGTCSLAVRIVIHEMKLTCEFESVDLHTKKTETGKDFLKINPKGSVPALVLDDGTLLTENAVIQQYLADTHQARELLPLTGDLSRYRVLEWLNFIGTELHKGLGPLFNPQIPDPLKEEIFKPKLNKSFDFVNHHLEGSGYLTGKSYTLADSYLFVTLRWLEGFNIPLVKWSHLAAYFERIKEREAVFQALREEGLASPVSCTR